MVFPFAGIDLVGESDGTVPIQPAGISSQDLKHTFWFVVLRNTFGMPGLDDQDENVDFETQLLEELLEHFETGARASFDQTTPYMCRFACIHSKADSARSCVSACRITSRLRLPSGCQRLRPCAPSDVSRVMHVN